MRAAMVWNHATTPKGQRLGFGAHIGTHVLHNLVEELDELHWPYGGQPDDRVRDYDVLIVNLFMHSTHIRQIKALHPRAYVIALPDSYMDEVFLGREMAWERNYLDELQAADALGYVSESNWQFYTALLDKPAFHIPIAIGMPAFFSQVRMQRKEDFILAVDHGARLVQMTMPNVAALRRIQQYSGLRVVYVNPSPQTKMYAEVAGLDVEWRGHMVYQDFVNLAGRARLGIDLYARHGMGRNEITLAYAGTPCIGSVQTEALADNTKVQPWYATDAALMGIELLTDRQRYQEWQVNNLAFVEMRYSFASAARRMRQVLREVGEDVEAHA